MLSKRTRVTSYLKKTRFVWRYACKNWYNNSVAFHSIVMLVMLCVFLSRVGWLHKRGPTQVLFWQCTYAYIWTSSSCSSTSSCVHSGHYGLYRVIWLHSVESPCMVDPQWNIWYWGSKWNLHTLCWDAVGCEWGTTSVYFGITFVCFIPSRLPVFAVEPQYRHQNFLFLSKVSFEGQIQNLQKFHVGLKFKWGL